VRSSSAVLVERWCAFVRNAERGFSTMELAGIAAVVAVAIVVIGGVMQNTRRVETTAVAQDAMTDVTTSLDAAYSSIAAYDPANRAILAGLPSQTASVTSGPWTATVKVAGSANGSVSIVSQTAMGAQASVVAPLPISKSP
jgi:uncharacterized membrane protein